MPSQDAPDESEVRQSYNFAPGYQGLVYRAVVPDSDLESGPPPPAVEIKREQADTCQPEPSIGRSGTDQNSETLYKLQSMKWGLIPFWTKRNPEYSSMLKTINCRDDSLLENQGMWTNMKKKKRCIVIAQGFFEWLKKNDGKAKIPHFVRRRDDSLMCFAGLWDCVQYEGSDKRHYTYTIITTSSNKQLGFLHDRMPVILEPGSEQLRRWLDPKQVSWTAELQSILQPYGKQLDCYPVSKDVGKVGNNSPSFLTPIDSVENKNNIANFFNKPKNGKETTQTKAAENINTKRKAVSSPILQLADETQQAEEYNGLVESNAPLPSLDEWRSSKYKRRRTSHSDSEMGAHANGLDFASQLKRQGLVTGDTVSTRPSSKILGSQEKRRGRSSTSNSKRSPTKPARNHDLKTPKITNYFSKQTL